MSLLIIDPSVMYSGCRIAGTTAHAVRGIVLDDIRMELARRCDRLVGRQRSGYCARRAEIIEQLRTSYDALTCAVRPGR